MKHELETARELARRAGKMAAELQGNVAVREKAGGEGTVTEADVEIDHFLVAELKKTFPKDAVLSEETQPEVALPAPRLWCVDPIDGTWEYSHDMDEYAVQIGLLVDGRPVLGAIALGDGSVLWGHEGGGAHREHDGNVEELKLRPKTDLESAIGVHSRRHLSKELEAALQRLGIKECIPAGGVGFKVVQLLTGRAHLYLHTGAGTKWWDTVGPAALCIAAGGTATDASGEPLDYTTNVRHGNGLLFAAPGLQELVLEKLRP